MGPGPNNCPGILRGKDTIEGERRGAGGGEEEGERKGESIETARSKISLPIQSRKKKREKRNKKVEEG